MNDVPDDPVLEPETLPSGCELPDGRVLTYGPHRDCGCADCIDAFEAFERGELRLPNADGLPW